MPPLPKPSRSLHFAVAHQGQRESRAVIARGLHESNVRHLGEYQWTDLDVYVRDDESRIVTGLISQFLFRTAKVL